MNRGGEQGLCWLLREVWCINTSGQVSNQTDGTGTPPSPSCSTGIREAGPVRALDPDLHM